MTDEKHSAGAIEVHGLKDEEMKKANFLLRFTIQTRYLSDNNKELNE